MAGAGNRENTVGCDKISQCFQSLNSEELDFINSRKTQLTYYQGETLFKQGAFAPYVLLIIDGLIKVYLQTGFEKQVNMHIAKTGDFLAFSSVFDEDVYNYSAVALKNSTVCMIDKRGLKELLIKNPEFGMQISSRHFSKETRLLEIIKNISYKQMRGKLASALLYLSDEEFREENVFQYLSRQDIADFASISTESTIKFLKEFEKENILTLVGKDIIIDDRTKLMEISRRG